MTTHIAAIDREPARAPAQPRAATQAAARPRLLFIDNIRVLLTIMVILFHLLITYGGNGSWYYREGREDFITGALSVWFLSVNQAYFMGLFLFISAYFVPGAYDRKGPGRFLLDRLIRLGIPVALYSWLIRPLLAYLDPVRYPDGRPEFWSFLTGKYFRDEAIFGAGPLWFVSTLLIFSVIYVAGRLLAQRAAPAPARARPEAEAPFPANLSIAIFALLIAVGAFAVRLVLPMGWNFVPLNLQFPFFVQYIALFGAGLVAYRQNWLQSLPERTGRLWLGLAALMVLGFWPLGLAGGALEGDLAPFLGGWHWQALAFALWESLLAVGMSIGLIYLFRRYANRQGPVAAFLARNAYAAYLIHEVVIITLAYAARDIVVYPLLKWVLVSLVAVPLCFGLSHLIRRLPYTERVL